MPRVGDKSLQNGRGNVQLAAPDPTWQARVGVANFNKDGLKPLELATLPKTADVKKVLALANKDPNDPASPLADRPPTHLSAYRDEKSKQFSILAWEPADFMGTLHVFDNAGNALGKHQILD